MSIAAILILVWAVCCVINFSTFYAGGGFSSWGNAKRLGKSIGNRSYHITTILVDITLVFMPGVNLLMAGFVLYVWWNNR